MKKAITFLIIFLIFSIPVSAQLLKTKLDFIGGIGYPEFFHAGLRYQYTDISQIGVYYGGDMGIRTSVIRTWNADHLYHFGKFSYHSNRPVWYARQGFTYSIHTTADRYYKYSYINLSGGREFNIKSWIGINADMGWIWQIREKTQYKDPSLDPRYRSKWVWLPLIRLQVSLSL